MVLALPAINPSVGLFLAQQLQLLRAGVNPSLIGANILADTGRANSQGDIPSTARYPRGWWVRDADKTFIFINGSENLQQAINYVYYVSSPSSGNSGGFQNTRFLSDAYDNYLSPITLTDTDQPGTIIFAGHSLGGVFAQALMTASNVRRIRTARSAVTFGSPKFVKRQDAEFYRGLDYTRWMNDSDPVPSCPPSVVVNIAGLASLYPLDLQNWSNTMQLAGGISLASDGTTQDLPVPPMGVVNFAASLGNWLWDIYSSRETVHDLPEYERRLANCVTRVNPPNSAVVVDSGPEIPLSLDRRGANRAIDAGIETIIHSSTVQNAARLGVPPEKAFKAVKIGPIWWVVFGGVLVAAGPRRKPCSLMANRGNQFLRRLQRMGGVDGNALGRLLIDYIDAASVEGGTFTPPIARLD